MRRVLGYLLGATALSGAGLVGFAWWTTRQIEAAVPPTGRFIDIAGQSIHYTDQGSGPAILFIHGLGGQTRNFPPAVIEPLARSHRVVVFDRPGSGFSTRPYNAAANLRAQAATVAALIERLGLHRPVLVGHSLGGALALTLALEHPDCVGALALIAPLTQSVDASPEPFRGLVVQSPLKRLLIAWTLAVPAAMARGAETLKEVFAPDTIPADYGTTYGGLLGLRPKAFYSASTDLVAAPADLVGLVPRYPTIAVPVGILYGSGDHILDPALHGRRLADAIPGAELELVDGGGHMTPIAQPARTVAFIERVAAKLAPLQRLSA